MSNIKQVSKIFRIIFQIGFILQPLILLIGWIFGPDIHLSIGNSGLGLLAYPRDIQVTMPMTFETKILGFLVSLLPTLVSMYLLYCLIKLFRCYEQGEIFTLNTVKYIRNIGFTLLAQIAVQVIYIMLITIVLTGFETLKINFSSANVDVVMLALLIILNSWIMAEGCKLREEQQLTI